MRLFACETCSQVLFFENTRCMTCHQALGFCVEASRLVSLGEAAAPGAVFDIALPPEQSEKFIKCKNYFEHDTCNWLVRVSDAQPYCRSCRLTEVVPDLSDVQNRQAWAEIESAKRRLLYTLEALRLPLTTKAEQPEDGVAFRFLRNTETEAVMTGHADGIITLNIAEADASYRENTREKLGEAYRTVLGHLRHEIGHFYWDRLVLRGAALEPFRALFGDERQSYDAAVQRHYAEGAPLSWADSFISAYATMHPWEDWAETWAHYLHMVDTLETAKSHGLTVRVLGKPEGPALVSTDALAFRDFESLMGGWQAVTLALNSLNRSMGMKDVYPFVLSLPVQDKLRFVHDLIQERTAQSARRAVPKLDAAKQPSVAAPAASPSSPAATPGPAAAPPAAQSPS